MALRSKRDKKERLRKVADALTALYPTAACALQYGGEPFRLLVMGILSAQCTDARVNEVSIPLFARYPDPAAMAAAAPGELEEIIRPCGCFRVKAKSLRGASEMLVSEFGGSLPQSMEELTRLPGVGRKVANLLRGDLWGYPAMVTDTHCIRLCGRFGLYPESLRDPARIEKILVSLWEGEGSSDFCHRIVFFGREYCAARAPRCESCPLGAQGLCEHLRGAGGAQ